VRVPSFTDAFLSLIGPGVLGANLHQHIRSPPFTRFNDERLAGRAIERRGYLSAYIYIQTLRFPALCLSTPLLITLPIRAQSCKRQHICGSLLMEEHIILTNRICLIILHEYRPGTVELVHINSLLLLLFPAGMDRSPARGPGRVTFPHAQSLNKRRGRHGIGTGQDAQPKRGRRRDWEPRRIE
jgi:hypothetical protein